MGLRDLFVMHLARLGGEAAVRRWVGGEFFPTTGPLVGARNEALALVLESPGFLEVPALERLAFLESVGPESGKAHPNAMRLTDNYARAFELWRSARAAALDELPADYLELLTPRLRAAVYRRRALRRWPAPVTLGGDLEGGESGLFIELVRAVDRDEWFVRVPNPSGEMAETPTTPLGHLTPLALRLQGWLRPTADPGLEVLTLRVTHDVRGRSCQRERCPLPMWAELVRRDGRWRESEQPWQRDRFMDSPTELPHVGAERVRLGTIELMVERGWVGNVTPPGLATPLWAAELKLEGAEYVGELRNDDGTLRSVVFRPTAERIVARAWGTEYRAELRLSGPAAAVLAVPIRARCAG